MFNTNVHEADKPIRHEPNKLYLYFHVNIGINIHTLPHQKPYHKEKVYIVDIQQGKVIF